MNGAPNTIDRPNLNEIVSEHIRRQIFDGALEPGAKIVEEEIAQSLGTSRTPVKLALTGLAKDGLVELLPRRGAFVKRFSRTDIVELYEIRRTFEGLAGRFAARYAQECDIEKLCRLNDEYRSVAMRVPEAREKRDHIKRAKRIDLEFHRTILNATRNKHLANLTGLEVIEFLSFLHAEPKSLKTVYGGAYAEHGRIIEALGNHDEDLAEATLKAHIKRAIENLGAAGEAEQERTVRVLDTVGRDGRE